ncbi:hypothetical protein E9529_04030 [Blastococcus sp. KM273128]|uniref:hypothetical protein n=1 Tax=Blastococcus sp. KM273128 TaxID=2570314 RepID=UPI001F1E1CA5|nr:hypothetical protein [Blastococcus sp. KM273128]MCF6743452.1 hypothetical protein [Blastococcus sp. KM273128]
MPWRRSAGPAAAMLGGATWSLHAVWLSTRPGGCVGADCRVPGASNRPSEDLAWLLLLSVVALGVAVSCLASGTSAAGRRPSRAGAVLLWAGAVLLAAGLAVNAVLVGDSPLWWLHDTDSLGRLVPVAGALLTGVGGLRAGGPSRWPGAALVVAALVALPFNAQDDRVLLSVPLGLAWLALGVSWAVREDVPQADLSRH